jgi:hypothetical protein
MDIQLSPHSLVHLGVYLRHRRCFSFCLNFWISDFFLSVPEAWFGFLDVESLVCVRKTMSGAVAMTVICSRFVWWVHVAW